MKLVKAEEARPGQRVARDVNDLRGNLLFPAGTQLSPEFVALCRQRNISHLFLEDDATGGGGADVETRRRMLLRDIDRQFSAVEGAPVMAALREAAKRYHAAKLGPS
jgi:hypothetical protein